MPIPVEVRIGSHYGEVRHFPESIAQMMLKDGRAVRVSGTGTALAMAGVTVEEEEPKRGKQR